MPEVGSTVPYSMSGTGNSGGRAAARTSAILNAAYQLLDEVGYFRLSIDAVAARAKASKATIYRRWPDKRSLVVATVLARAQAGYELAQNAPSLRDDLITLVDSVASQARVESSRVFFRLLIAAEEDPILAETLRVPALERRRQECRDIVQRAIGRAELHRVELADLLFDLTMGKILSLTLLSDGAFTAARRTQFVNVVLMPALEAADRWGLGDGGKDRNPAALDVQPR